MDGTNECMDVCQVSDVRIDGSDDGYVVMIIDPLYPLSAFDSLDPRSC